MEIIAYFTTIFASIFSDELVSKEAIMQKMNLFQYYGNQFYLGTIIYKMGVKCPLFDSVEVDATIVRITLHPSDCQKIIET